MRRDQLPLYMCVCVCVCVQEIETPGAEGGGGDNVATR
jgi:hypothetical protein